MYSLPANEKRSAAMIDHGRVGTSVEKKTLSAASEHTIGTLDKLSRSLLSGRSDLASKHIHVLFLCMLRFPCGPSVVSQ